jgi:hypothetical protein
MSCYENDVVFNKALINSFFCRYYTKERTSYVRFWPQLEKVSDQSTEMIHLGCHKLVTMDGNLVIGIAINIFSSKLLVALVFHSSLWLFCQVCNELAVASMKQKLKLLSTIYTRKG